MAKDDAPGVQIGLDLVTSVLEQVAKEEIDMATGREQIGEWWNKLSPVTQKEIAQTLFEKIDRMRKISDAVFQEFSTISASAR